MADYADLEIGLSRADAGQYRVDFRFSRPDSDADVRLAGNKSPHISFDFDALTRASADTAAYGALLSKYLFSDAALSTAFAQACSNTQASDLLLRLRLLVDASAPELHSLYWETLINPLDQTTIATSERLLLTRYLSSQDWRRVKLRSRNQLCCLVAVPNPTDLVDYSMPPIDVEGELQRTKSSLGTLPWKNLAADGPVDLDHLVNRLRDDYDCLYLVCHGALNNGKPLLCLEDNQGKTCFVDGGELVTRVNELQTPPRLVVLASCQSAAMTAADNGLLCALGPKLAAAGVAAVIAMQGSITQRTAAQFMSVFFKELASDGQVDRAVAVARGAVREYPDCWMPVLFMRLKSGRISYKAGFGDDAESMRKWPSLLSNIQAKQCTPILGPGLTDWLFGSRREMAARWAEASGFPMSTDSRESLPQVSQYVAVDQDTATMQRALVDHLVEEMKMRYGDIVPSGEQAGTFDNLLSTIAAKLNTQPVTQPLHILASLPLPIYVTTVLGNFLTDALVETGKKPVVEMCRWNDYLDRQPSIFDSEPDYRPSPERPLVYHLFGRLSNPDSLVLTEDDYFDFLIGVTSRNELIPGVVRRALTDSALLFLGFELDDWDFRVLYRSVMSREGRRRRAKYAHVAAQVDPEGERITNPQRARKYLESYFEGEDISIYWGSVADFAGELERRMMQG